MDARIGVITLAVSDLDRALEFYRGGLGLDSPGVIDGEFTGDDTSPSGAVAMFQLQDGLILALYPRTELATATRHRREHRGGGCVAGGPETKITVRVSRFGGSVTRCLTFSRSREERASRRRSVSRRVRQPRAR